MKSDPIGIGNSQKQLQFSENSYTKEKRKPFAADVLSGEDFHFVLDLHTYVHFTVDLHQFLSKPCSFRVHVKSFISLSNDINSYNSRVVTQSCFSNAL